MLVKIPGMRVLALRSRERGLAVSDSLGRKSSVKTLLRGDVQHIGKGVRVTVSLINAEDGVTLSTERYSQDSLDVFALRDTVAQSVVAKLRLVQGRETPADWKRRPTKNPDASKRILKGGSCSERAAIRRI